MSGELPGSVWRKSTRSGSQGGNCVEVAILPRATKLRDSKNPHGGTIDLTPQAWQIFLDSVKHDEFTPTGRPSQPVSTPHGTSGAR